MDSRSTRSTQKFLNFRSVGSIDTTYPIYLVTDFKTFVCCVKNCPLDSRYGSTGDNILLIDLECFLFFVKSPLYGKYIVMNPVMDFLEEELTTM